MASDLKVNLPLFEHNLEYTTFPCYESHPEQPDKDVIVGYTAVLHKVWIYGFDVNGNQLKVNIFPLLDKLVIEDMENEIAEYYGQ